jgi:DNA-binding beta-propeller fold protein YncE
MRRTGINRVVVLLVLLLLPLTASAAEAMKYKYALSLYTDEKGGGLNQPEGVACGADRLVVADTGNGRLILYSLQGGEPKGGTEIKVPQILYPIRVKLNSKGEILVLDERQRKIVRLNREGAYLGYVEPSGLPTEGMIFTAGLDVDGKDDLYLLDILGNRVLVLDPNGKFQRQIGLPKQHGFFTDLAVDSKGTVFVVDGVDAMVYSNAADPSALAPFTPKLKDDMKFAGNMTADDKGALFISDQNSGGVVIVGPDGSLRSRFLSLGWKEGTVRYPAQICVTKADDLFIADRANSRIQEFSPLK